MAILCCTALTCFGSGCGGPPPDFVTPLGASFFLNGSTSLSLDEVHAQEARFEQRLRPLTGPDLRACWQQVQVHLEPGGAFPCAGRADVQCAGEQYGPHLKVADAPASRSAWRHELLHWIHECATAEGADPDHTRPEWRLLEDG